MVTAFHLEWRVRGSGWISATGNKTVREAADTCAAILSFIGASRAAETAQELFLAPLGDSVWNATWEFRIMEDR